MTRNAIKAADEQLERAVTARIAAGQKKAIDALIRLVRWVPEGGFCWPHAYQGQIPQEDIDDDMRILNDRMDPCPFATEIYTYALFGKDQGRSYLALLGELARSLGFKDGLWGLEQYIKDQQEDEEGDQPADDDPNKDRPAES